MWRTRPSVSSVSRVRYVEATSDGGTRPPTPAASSSTVAGPSAANSASRTRRRAAETRRPPARSAATALSMVATPRGRTLRAGVIGRPSGRPGAGRKLCIVDLPSGPAVWAGRSSGACARHLHVRITRTCELPAADLAGPLERPEAVGADVLLDRHAAELLARLGEGAVADDGDLLRRQRRPGPAQDLLDRLRRVAPLEPGHEVRGHDVVDGERLEAGHRDLHAVRDALDLVARTRVAPAAGPVGELLVEHTRGVDRRTGRGHVLPQRGLGVVARLPALEL